VRLVSYNILDGGEGRADPLAEVIAAQRPDIVALIEADHEAVVWRIADRLGMDAVRAAGKRHAIAILSRWPIVASVNHGLLRPELTDGLLEATIRQGPDREWLIGALHLHPRAGVEDDLLRQAEVACVLDVFSEYRRGNRPHLLAGDFNADSPVQEIHIEQCKPATRQSWLANGNQLPRGAARKLLDAGYADSLHALRPIEAARIGTFTTQFPGQRIDYVFTFGMEGRLKSAWVEQDRLAAYASDHFPIGLEAE
jgi:exodeoxyribonuclease III